MSQNKTQQRNPCLSARCVYYARSLFDGDTSLSASRKNSNRSVTVSSGRCHDKSRLSLMKLLKALLRFSPLTLFHRLLFPFCLLVNNGFFAREAVCLCLQSSTYTPTRPFFPSSPSLPLPPSFGTLRYPLPNPSSWLLHIPDSHPSLQTHIHCLFYSFFCSETMIPGAGRSCVRVFNTVRG